MLEQKNDRRIIVALSETEGLPTRVAFDAIINPDTLRVRVGVPEVSLETLLKIPRTRGKWLKRGVELLRIATENEWELVANIKDDPSTVAILSSLRGVPHSTVSLYTNLTDENIVDDYIDTGYSTIARARFTCRFPEQLRRLTPVSITQIRLQLEEPTWVLMPPFNSSCLQGDIGLSMIQEFRTASSQYIREREGVYVVSTFGAIMRRLHGMGDTFADVAHKYASN